MLSPRHREVMEVIRTNSGISFNALYIATSPVCQRTGVWALATQRIVRAVVCCCGLLTLPLWLCRRAAL